MLPDRLIALDNVGIGRLAGIDDDDDDNGTVISFDDDDNDGILYSLIGCNNDDDTTDDDDDDPVVIIPCNWSDVTVAMLTGWGRWRPYFSLLLLPLLLLILVDSLSLLGDSTSIRFSSSIGESLPLSSTSFWLMPISPLILLLTTKPLLVISFISNDHALSRLLLLLEADPNLYDNAVVTLCRPSIWWCCSSNVLVASVKILIRHIVT